MDAIQLTLPGSIVKKHNQMVRSKINISSITASRILACLIAAIRTDDTDFRDIYKVPLINYLSADDGGNIYRQARIACKELVAATVETEWQDIDELYLMPFFTSVRYRKGNVEAKFNPEMSGMLLELNKRFTEYNLIEYLKLPSLYSQKIFEFVKSWANAPKVDLPIDKLHHLLDTPPSFRKDFKAVRTRILEKAHKDIHKETTLRYKWNALKKGRKVVAVRFVFPQKPKDKVASSTESVNSSSDGGSANPHFLAAYRCRKNHSHDCAGDPSQQAHVCEFCMSSRRSAPA